MTKRYKATIPGTENVLVGRSYANDRLLLAGHDQTIHLPEGVWQVEEFDILPTKPGAILRHKETGSLYVRMESGHWNALDRGFFERGLGRVHAGALKHYDILFEGVYLPESKPTTRYEVFYRDQPIQSYGREDYRFDTLQAAEDFLEERAADKRYPVTAYSVVEID